MIRMVMGQKNASDFAEWQAELIQPLHRTASCIEDEFLRPDFDQRAGSETIDSRRRRSTAQKSDAKQIVRWLQHSRIPVSSADPLSNSLFDSVLHLTSGVTEWLEQPDFEPATISLTYCK